MSNDKQERIVCAAVKVNYIKFFKGKPRDAALTKEVVFPILSRELEDHVTAVDVMLSLSGDEGSDKFSAGLHEYGFITNKNRFVDPKEAADIALEFDQVISVNKLWDAFGQAQEEVEKDLLQEKIYQKGSQILQEGLKPEDLY